MAKVNTVNTPDKTKSRKFYIVKSLGVKLTYFVIIASFILAFVGMFIKNPPVIVFKSWMAISITFIVNVVIQVVGYFLYNTKQKREVDKDIILKTLDMMK